MGNTTTSVGVAQQMAAITAPMPPVQINFLSSVA